MDVKDLLELSRTYLMPGNGKAVTVYGFVTAIGYGNGGTDYQYAAAICAGKMFGPSNHTNDKAYAMQSARENFEKACSLIEEFGGIENENVRVDSSLQQSA